jgi:glutamine cyclotransferase
MRFRRRLSRCLAFCAAVLAVSPFAGSKQGATAKPAETVKSYRYEVLARYPHDAQAFTQGLIYHDGYLYESTGLEGNSSLRKVELNTGKVLKKVDLDPKYFGEGLTIFQGKIYQITWLSGVGFVYDVGTLAKVAEFHYDGEGWGLTHDERSLILSDGSNRLQFLDPKEFKVKRSIEVFYHGKPLSELNELEYINGQIFSNVWHQNLIARIDPATGRLLGIVDLTGLGSGLGLGSEDVLNGIAYVSKTDNLLVTGKRWPFLFRIRLIESSE